MTGAQLLLNIAAEQRVAFLPTAQTVEAAYDYLRSKVHQLETFDTLALAENWAAGYGGFPGGRSTGRSSPLPVASTQS